jgi:outer membrane protein assembly factor BamB
LAPTRFRVEAEDLVLCFDAATGKVLWKAVEPGGLIRAGSKRGGFHVAPAVDGGRVFAVGSTGRVFAYDAASGAKLWQGDVGDAFKAADQERIADLAQAAAGKIVLPKRPSWHTSVVAVNGIVVTADFRGGLRGCDAATGALKWSMPDCISGYATPNVWRRQGKAWLLCATAGGSMRLINPQDGKAAWTVDGLGKNWPTLMNGAAST